jgi:hypothetical protein
MPFCFESVAFWGCSFGIEARDRIDWADAALALAAFQAGFSNYFRLGGDSGARRKCRACTKLNEPVMGDHALIEVFHYTASELPTARLRSHCQTCALSS